MVENAKFQTRARKTNILFGSQNHNECQLSLGGPVCCKAVSN